MNDRTKLIFGFGSLINTRSLHRTAPHATDVRPAYVTGFRRNFSVWAKNGSTHLVPANTPFCALDIQKCEERESRINGICFTVNEYDFEQLVNREREYKLVETPAYDFETDEKLGTCILFSSCKNNGEYEAGSRAQTGYLHTCVEGAKQYGEDFYKMFLETTYIGNQRLSGLPELTKELTK